MCYQSLTLILSIPVRNTSCQSFIDKSFQKIHNITQSLRLLAQFRRILHRESLRHDLDDKFLMIFKSYGQELDKVDEIYTKHTKAPNVPPVSRNMPSTSGRIKWARQLYRRITIPMDAFKEHPAVRGSLSVAVELVMRARHRLTGR